MSKVLSVCCVLQLQRVPRRSPRAPSGRAEVRARYCQCVAAFAVCCGVLQFVAVSIALCCSVLQCVLRLWPRAMPGRAEA